MLCIADGAVEVFPQVQWDLGKAVSRLCAASDSQAWLAEKNGAFRVTCQSWSGLLDLWSVLPLFFTRAISCPSATSSFMQQRNSAYNIFCSINYLRNRIIYISWIDIVLYSPASSMPRKLQKECLIQDWSGKKITCKFCVDPKSSPRNSNVQAVRCRGFSLKMCSYSYGQKILRLLWSPMIIRFCSDALESAS
jgi:hypothetical protein